MSVQAADRWQDLFARAPDDRAVSRLSLRVVRRGGQPFLCENPAQGVQKESAPLEELQPRTDTESK